MLSISMYFVTGSDSPSPFVVAAVSIVVPDSVIFRLVLFLFMLPFSLWAPIAVYVIPSAYWFVVVIVTVTSVSVSGVPVLLNQPVVGSSGLYVIVGASNALSTFITSTHALLVLSLSAVAFIWYVPEP